MGASATNDRYADSLIDAGNYAEYLNWGFKEYDKYKNTGECRPKSNASFNIGRAHYYLRNDKK